MKRFLLIAALLLGFVGSARAANLYTAPFWGGTVAGDFVNCKLANVTTSAKTVRIRLIDSLGTVLQDSGSTLLPAGQILGVNSGGPVGTNVVCHFVAPSKASVRCSGSFVDNLNAVGNDTFVVPAQ